MTARLLCCRYYPSRTDRQELLAYIIAVKTNAADLVSDNIQDDRAVIRCQHHIPMAARDPKASLLRLHRSKNVVQVAANLRKLRKLGALLRREGLYSSLLAYWRRERANGILEAPTPQKRGRKSKRNPLAEENEKLRRQNVRLTEDLRKANIIVDVQKKVAALLGQTIPEEDPEEKS